MSERIDYQFNSAWDIEFTDWNDIRTATDERVLIQNFVLAAHDAVSSYVGETISQSDLQIIANKLESEYAQRDAVDSITIQELRVSNKQLTIAVTINSNEFNRTVRLY